MTDPYVNPSVLRVVHERPAHRCSVKQRCCASCLCVLPEFTATDDNGSLEGADRHRSVSLCLDNQDKLWVSTPASSARRPAAMVETPVGCVFEDIQYEDIQVEAVNLLTNNSSAEDMDVSSALLGKCSGSSSLNAATYSFCSQARRR